MIFINILEHEIVIKYDFNIYQVASSHISIISNISIISIISIYFMEKRQIAPDSVSGYVTMDLPTVCSVN